MATSESTAIRQRSWPAAWPIYYGWVNVVLAALAMTATLPGRTHGLGLITKPLLEDLQISEGRLGILNFWAVILGSLVCVPVGRLLDRWGTRFMSVLVIVGLGIAVVLMSGVHDEASFFWTLLVVRGLGQGALSVISMAMVGKWFRRRLGPAMGVYAFLLAIGFIAGVLGMGGAVFVYGWRPAWGGMGWIFILVLGPLFWALVRSTPADCGLTDHDAPLIEPTSDMRGDITLTAALRSPAFWVFSLATSQFGLIWAAITFFNQSILNEHGFDEQTFLLVMAVLTGSGLISNLLGGWLAMRMPLGRLLGASMIFLAGAVLAFPYIQSQEQLLLYGFVLGAAGGIVTVVFFAFYGQAFGRTHLGRIQGAAQVLFVLASAVGPVFLSYCKEETGSYDPIFIAWAPVTAVLGIAVWFVHMPGARRTA